jgi:signal transduction histidine kinase
VTVPTGPGGRDNHAPGPIVWLLVAAPALVGLAAGLLVQAVRPGLSLVTTTSLATATVVAGLALTVLLAAFAARRALAHRRELARQADEHARAEHIEREVHAERLRLLLRLDHELKNPLQALRLALAGARDDPQASLASVEVQAGRIGTLLGDLRKLAEIERRPLDLAPVDLGALLTEVRDEVAARPGGAQRHWSVVLPRAPWPVPAMTADPDLVFLAVHNLAENALKYSRPGDRIELRVSEPAEGWVLLEIADTGLGVPAGEEERVWEELARATSTRGLPGTGMGLPLVRTVARRHGGTADLRSRDGHGTVVTLRLPVVPPASDAAAPVS